MLAFATTGPLSLSLQDGVWPFMYSSIADGIWAATGVQYVAHTESGMNSRPQADAGCGQPEGFETCNAFESDRVVMLEIVVIRTAAFKS